MQSASRNILFVDDDADSCELMNMMLVCAGVDYKTTAVATAREALNLMAQESFDLLIVDYKLPEMSGVELCRSIRKTNHKTPILFFTGMSRDADRELAITAGANSYLIKPNDLDKFADTVKRLLSENRTIEL